MSLNPDVDIGQVEGAFVMGIGYWTSEDLVYDAKTGALVNTRTWVCDLLNKTSQYQRIRTSALIAAELWIDHSRNEKNIC